MGFSLTFTLDYQSPRAYVWPYQNPNERGTMAHSPAATAAKPAAPPVTQLTPEGARREGVNYARANRHPSYDAACSEFIARHGHRTLIWFEAGYYDASCGWA